MDFFWVFVIISFIGIVMAVFYLYIKKQPMGYDMRKEQACRPMLNRSRRRRRSGGFYPIGYTGDYLEGEDLVEELIWMAVLAEMSDVDRADLVEYGEYLERLELTVA